MAKFFFLMAAVVAQYDAEYYRDFRSQGFDDAELRLVGTEGPLKVKAESSGLRITIPRQKNALRPIGFVPQFKVRGDFQITITYEIIGYERPTSGHGVGVSLYLVMESPTKEAAHVGRFARAGESQVVAAARISSIGDERKVLRSKSFPVEGMAGKLRCTRTGSTLHYSVAELRGDDFRELYQDEFGPGELEQVRVAAENGSSSHAVDVRLLDFRIRAQELPGPSSAQPPGSNQTGWIAALVLGVGFSLGLWYWREVRARRKSF